MAPDALPLRLKVYGLDFTSAPARRKPLVALRCTLEEDTLRVEDADTLTSFEEFEAWLIADSEALKAVFRHPLTLPKSPERLGRRQAKEMLRQWCEQHARSREAGEIRSQLALSSNLETLSRECGAFATFLQKLRAPRD